MLFQCIPRISSLSTLSFRLDAQHTSPVLQIGSILGLGLAYAGSNREDVLQLLQSVFDSKNSREVVGITALACGLIACGTCNGEVSSVLLQTLMTRTEAELGDTYCRFIPLGEKLCNESIFYLVRMMFEGSTFYTLIFVPD